MREHDDEAVSCGDGTEGFDPAFAVFSLTHAECADGLVELRLGEGLLLGWCPLCAALELFGPPQR